MVPCWRNERKGSLTRPFPFPAILSLSSFSPSLSLQVSGFQLSARSLIRLPTRLLVRALHGEQTGFAIKRILSLEMRGDQREDPTYTLKLDLGLSTSRYVFSFSSRPLVALAGYLLTFLAASPFAFRATFLSPRYSPSHSLDRVRLE